ncbi:ABC transporter substrate-binding protein [Desulfitobacterium sp.]|uniref:ABC transporter substrate-binding protein n=1 Tax=Desulfitobacterium sp. TaxID=49981 RepID=UPI002B220E86|nr:ABC transporter substrate-binding protein [Desulfitobacterium sp.]MEA4902960.1 ABC transporter substrate-binding protein [Desulfitobacterium sp.]
MTRKNKMVSVVLMAAMIFSLLLTGCGSQSASQPQQPTTQTITDHAGRTVTIPAQINRCYYTSPLGMIMVYSLAPDKMVGWSMKLTDKEKKYIPEQYSSLPFLGGLQMNGKINTEELLKAKPDVIFSVGPDPLSDTNKSDADKLQQQLNIPVLVVDGDIRSTEKAYTFIGQILGVEDKAQELAAYCTKTLNEVTAATQSIPEDKRVKFYYAEGPKGLATEPKGGSHALVLDLVNGNNVAQVTAKGGGGMSDVSLEQVLKWNPDVILSWGVDAGGAYDLIRTSEDWKNINAVKNNKVIEIPNYPFNWFDRPPSVNRFLGLKWLANTFYPDYYKVDMVKEVKEFYALFYHANLSDDDAKDLLKNSTYKVNG